MSFSPILLFHICAGTSGLLSGAVAMSFRKGSRRHRVAGNVFVISMLSLSSSGAFLAFMKSQMNNVFGGVLTFHLVATAWVTARRRDGETGIFDWVALLVALALGAVIVTYGLEAANSQTGLKGGIPAGMYFFLGSVALLSAAGDVRMLLRGGVFGAQVAGKTGLEPAASADKQRIAHAPKMSRDSTPLNGLRRPTKSNLGPFGSNKVSSRGT